MTGGLRLSNPEALAPRHDARIRAEIQAAGFNDKMHYWPNAGGMNDYCACGTVQDHNARLRRIEGVENG